MNDKTAYQVEIRHFAYSPKELTIPADTRIVWTTTTTNRTWLLSSGAAFKASPALDTNDSFAVVLARPGTYAYYCGFHPMMVGQITVR